jgi:O-antigen ligase
MSSLRLNARALDRRELLIAAASCGFTALIIVAAGRKLSPTLALMVPLALVLVAVLLTRPLLCVCLAAGLAVLLEGKTYGLFTVQGHFYDPLYKRLTALDALVVLAALAVAVDMLRDRRRPRFPRQLRFAALILVLGMVSGIVVGKNGGAGLKSLVLAENLIFYLLLLPLAVANLKVDRRQLRLLLGGAFVLAVVKALLGLLEIAAHKGLSINGSANLTYYEPTANFFVMLALLAIVAAVIARFRPPLWMVLSAFPLIASLLLSYRRSFWIATVLGLLLVVLLALSPVGRRLLVPTALFVAAGIWLLGSASFQSSSPIVKRAASLAPSKLTTNVEDRYRIDERANVLADLESKPISGLGILVPWKATKRPLPVEHEDARQYVHFAALWWWMKLGILGLFAYPLLLLSAARLAWRIWRRGVEPIMRAFGLASLCGLAGLVVAETTATFTGADLRFTVVMGVLIGLLALLAEDGTRSEEPAEEPGEDAPAWASDPPPALTPAAG